LDETKASARHFAEQEAHDMKGVLTLPSLIYLAVMIAVIVGVDVAFFKDRFWERLAANVGLVLLFGAFYFRLFRGP
jgi:hypothetical protein